jgi:hypothetical protein
MYFVSKNSTSKTDLVCEPLKRHKNKLYISVLNDMNFVGIYNHGPISGLLELCYDDDVSSNIDIKKNESYMVYDQPLYIINKSIGNYYYGLYKFKKLNIK